MKYINFEKDGNGAVITISREKSLNALNSEVLKELGQAIEDTQNYKDIYCLIVTGAGEKSFVAGADIAEMKDLDREGALTFAKLGCRVFRKLEKTRVPTIAAVNGYALGGGLELALACDLRIASDNALFALPETGLGVIPGYGGTQRLPRLIGESEAKKLIFTGERVSANRALELGIVNEVVSLNELMNRANEVAGKIARQSPIGVANAKQAIMMGLEAGVDVGFESETELFSNCFETTDQKNAMQAFVNKEKFSGFENR